jgi:hypothetical protein
MSGSTAEGDNPLDLTSLDAESLFLALGAVDRVSYSKEPITVSLLILRLFLTYYCLSSLSSHI